MFLELKKSPYLWAYAAVVIVVIGALAWRGVITGTQAGVLLAAALGSPGLLGSKQPPDDPGPGQTPVLTEEAELIPISHVTSPPAARIVIACLALAACGPMTPGQKTDLANSTYAAEQLKCVDDAKTKAEADKCRAEKRAQWDAGAP